ncbi:DUF4157 domain-containing protein [Mycobacterium sp. OTB74]|uniref:eCIS core domain-containing protein n=1 Tax=Mycobacterium sp. OTB74 TaxID=1853452 RepID=UPI0024772A99|nr:DUF4157 domain-containing protein [Mycobacterium sp. OTB74]
MALPPQHVSDPPGARRALERARPGTEPGLGAPRSPVAGMAARPSAVPVQRACAGGGSGGGGDCHCDEKEEPAAAPVQRRAGTSGGAAPATGLAAGVEDVVRGSGAPLDAGLRASMEAALGADLGAVRIHTGPGPARSARALNAVAYTTGTHVVFGDGAYAPATTEGRRTLAHELTHVVQQSRGPVAGQPTADGRLALSAPADPFEREADQTAARVIGRIPPATVPATPRLIRPASRGGTAPVQRLAQGESEYKGLKCDLDHLDTECGGAAASCQTVAEYCKKYPDAAAIDTLHANAVAGATQKKEKLPNAAANLLHFLDGSGTERVLPVPLVRDHPATKDKLDGEHLQKFLEGAKKRFDKGELKIGGTVDMKWTGTANAFTGSLDDDLGLALGGYTLCSKVTAKAENPKDVGGNPDFLWVHLEPWTVQAFDCYNWDPGKGINLPGATDNDLCCLQNAGKGKHFRVHTDAWSRPSQLEAIRIVPEKPAAPPPPKKEKKEESSR